MLGFEGAWDDGVEFEVDVFGSTLQKGFPVDGVIAGRGGRGSIGAGLGGDGEGEYLLGPLLV